MRSVHEWLAEYGSSHQNKTNKTIHWVCVPLIMFSLTGLLWSIPVPQAVHNVSFPVNFAILLIIMALVYYIMLSPRLTIGFLPVAIILIGGNYYLAKFGQPDFWIVSASVFALAWVGQFIGHNKEGKKPSFFKDLQFLLIGPLWLLSFVYKKLHISY